MAFGIIGDLLYWNLTYLNAVTSGLKGSCSGPSEQAYWQRGDYYGND
jgi:hypothetical protein